MRFENKPNLIVSVQEWETLDKALKLCRDMDCETGACSCSCCPKDGECSTLVNECVFTIAHKALKEIIDMAIIK